MFLLDSTETFLFFNLSLDLFFLVQADLNPKYLLGLCFFCLSLLVFVIWATQFLSLTNI